MYIHFKYMKKICIHRIMHSRTNSNRNSSHYSGSQGIWLRLEIEKKIIHMKHIGQKYQIACCIYSIFYDMITMLALLPPVFPGI